MDQPGSARPGERPPWHHLWIVRYGPLGLCVLGLALLTVSMTVSRTDAIEVAYTALGTVLVIAGILIPRLKGPVEVSTTGVKGQLSTIQELDSRAFAVVGTGAVAPLVRISSSAHIGWQTLTEPIRPSDVSIRAILNAAAEQGWAVEPDPNTGRFVLSSESASEKVILPGEPGWMATHDLLRVLEASGLRVPMRGDKDGE